eukprot:COSAG06_NODE_44807_length_360_cov_0.793103_1_plen_39_part_10
MAPSPNSRSPASTALNTCNALARRRLVEKATDDAADEAT